MDSKKAHNPGGQKGRCLILPRTALTLQGLMVGASCVIGKRLILLIFPFILLTPHSFCYKRTNVFI